LPFGEKLREPRNFFYAICSLSGFAMYPNRNERKDGTSERNPPGRQTERPWS